MFSMETPCWSPSEGLQDGGRKPMGTSGINFTLSKYLFSLLTTDNIWATQNSKT